MFKSVVILCLACFAYGAPQEKLEFWKGSALESMVENLKNNCAENINNIACIQFKAFTFLDNVLKGNLFQFLTDNVQISRNGYENQIGTKRSSADSLEGLENFIKSNDVTFKLPAIGDLKIDSRNLDDNEINFKLNFGSEAEERGKKHKLKKVFLPLITFVLLKVMTIVPFVIGLLALKAWNGLQLSLFSFIIASGLAIFQLCQKLANDGQAPVILEHPPAQYKRSLEEEAQSLAYGGYVQ